MRPISNLILDLSHSISRTTYKTMSQTSVVFGVGCIALLIHWKVAIPLFSLGGSIVLTTLALNVLRLYDKNLIADIEFTVLDFDEQYPYIRIITFIFIWTFSSLALNVCCFASIMLGIYSGALLRTEGIKREQLQDPEHNYGNDIV